MKLPVSEVVITLFFLYAIITYYNRRSVRSAPIAGIVIVSILYVTGQCTLAMLDAPGFYQAVFLFAVNLGFAFMLKMTWKQILMPPGIHFKAGIGERDDLDRENIAGAGERSRE